MRLKLRNIRQHKSLDLELPDSGVVMLQGRSGSGKTTVLDSIREALYGTSSDMAPWSGSAKRSVELEINKPAYLKIVRTGGPSSLTVTDANGAEYKDEVAQAVINKTLSMNENEFEACSYIMQGAANSLLNFSPAQQLEFIESLSTSGSNPDDYKKQILSKIKGLKESIAPLSAELASKNESLASEIHKITDAESKLPADIEQKSWDLTISALEAKILDINRNSVEKVAPRIAEIKKALADPIWVQLASIEVDIVKAESKIASAEHNYYALSGQLGNTAVTSEETFDGLTKSTAELEKKIEYLQNLQKLKDFAATVRTKLSLKEGQLTGQLNEMKAALSADVSAKLSELAELQAKNKELSVYDKYQKCPDCSTDLVVLQGHIAKPSHSADEISAMQAANTAKIQALSQANAESKKTIDYISQVLFEAESLMAKLKADPNPGYKTEEECRQVIATNNEAKTKILEAKALRADLALRVKKAEQELAQATAELQSLLGVKKQSEEKYTLKNKEEMQTELNTLTEFASARALEVAGWESTLAALRQEKAQFALHQSLLSVIASMKQSKDTLISRITEITKELEQKHEDLAATERLKELSDFAAVQAIDNTISAINASAEHFVNKMFPDDGTVITLKNTSQTKSGEERAKIGCEIFHKGHLAKKLSNFSGGEKSRAALAFQLGLSELYQSPILLVDEGFAGLEEDGKRACLEVLKDVGGDRLVFVIEHGAPESFFDSVIRLD